MRYLDPERARELAQARYQKRKKEHNLASRRNHLTRKYGMTLEEYESQLDRQQGVCAACGVTPTRNLDVDHDHETGAMRGLLCNSCNRLVGVIEKDPVKFRGLVAYLERAGFTW